MASPGSQSIPSPQIETLPVLDDVNDYDKIQRIGEGTYGVVCGCFWLLFEWSDPRRELPGQRLWTLLQTRQSTNVRESWWPSRS